MVARFTIDGEPMGKERPKFSNRGGIKRAYTPTKTAEYEEYTKWCYIQQCNDIFFEQGMPITIIVEAYFGIPKSITKKRRKEILETEEIPTKKPDTDNILKIIKDALNGVAYYDDAQVGMAVVAKHYSENPRVEVTIVNGNYIRNFLLDVSRTYKE